MSDNSEVSLQPLELPVLPRRDVVIFPGIAAQIPVIRASSLRAVEEAVAKESPIVIVARHNLAEKDVTFDQLYSVGTQAIISRAIKMPDGATSLWLHGQQRVKITEPLQEHPFLRARVLPLSETGGEGMGVEALRRAVLALFEKCVKLSPHLPEETYIAAMNTEGPGPLADFIAFHLDLALPKKQEILETLDISQRLQKVSLLLAGEVDVLELQKKISSQVQDEVDKSHREYILREQLRAIQKELGEIDPAMRETTSLREKILAAGMSEEARKKALEEMERLGYLPHASPEVAVVRNYLDWLVSLPWNKETPDNMDLRKAAQVLEENHYGLKKVKERILEYISVRKLAGEKLKGPILCFVGPPGVGKTSLGRSIAQALGRKFARVSLGGIRDEAEMRGHRRTYVGALPGRIIQTMRQAGTINPVFMLDEIDKVGIDFRGDPSSALLEVLDPEQNHSFSDHYLEVPYNLSKVMFITTANLLDPVLPALKDRLEVIELPGYTDEEKLVIATKFLVPRQLQENGLNQGQLSFFPGAISRITREYTREAGVRNLERELGNICRKAARHIAEGTPAPSVITARALPHYLGPPLYFWGKAQERDEIGVATGVARTEMGGDVLEVEVAFMEGKGNLLLTGKLGEVIKESAQAALSYVRSRANTWGVKPEFFEKTDIHIHIPAGATPKDGPSAGITIATALASALLRKPVKKEVAMTGEITLRGRVLPVGGLKEKVLAAHRAGIKTFILPKKNDKDLEEIPLRVRKGLHFVTVEHIEEVLPQAFGEAHLELKTA